MQTVHTLAKGQVNIPTPSRKRLAIKKRPLPAVAHKCRFLWWLALLALAGCTLAPVRPKIVARGDYDTTREYIGRLARYEMAKHSVAGLSIALVDDQRVVWEEGFGYADREKKVPATATTLYRVGSISKLFTDVAAMQLMEQGRLDLDRPLSEYLPGFAIKEHSPAAGPITLRQLMTHHSGLPANRAKGFFCSHPLPFTALLNELHNDYAAYPPGEIFSYSNVGISLLGAAVQQVAGEPFAEYMHRALLAPLGMTHSSFGTSPTDSPLMAKGYRGLKAETAPGLRDVPSGGLNASVEDLSRFIEMFFAGGVSHGHRILKAKSVAEMLRPQNTGVPLDLNFRVGLGWMLSTMGKSTIRNGGPVAHHAGGTIFYHSQIYLLPRHKLGVVVLANSSTAVPVVNRLAPETLKLALEAKNCIRQPPPVQTETREVTWPETKLDGWVGYYTTMAGYARIIRDGGRLRVTAMGRTFNLVPRSDGGLHLDYTVLGLFHINLGPLDDFSLHRLRLGGRDLIVAQQGGQRMVVGQRIEPPSHLKSWRARLGKYEITNLGGDYRFVTKVRLREENGFLLMASTMAETGKTIPMVLQPLSGTQARLLGIIADGGDTVRVVKVDGEERLAYSGYLLRRTNETNKATEMAASQERPRF